MSKKKNIKVVVASSEATPFAKTGGLADVAGALPQALAELGCDVTLFMPLYRDVVDCGAELLPTGVKVSVPVGRRVLEAEIFSAKSGGVTVYFVKRDEYFDRTYLYATPQEDYFDNLERFVFFSRAVMEATIKLGLAPDVMHCNDWQSGLIPAYLKSLYRDVLPDTACVFTIHNLAYQGLFPASFFDLTGLPQDMFAMDGVEFWGRINLLKAGIVYSDVITTVSNAYSKEIQTPEYGCGLEGILTERQHELFGVINGVDYKVWNPEVDGFIARKYSVADMKGKGECKKDLLKEYGLKSKPTTPVIGIISRLADQKGFDILSKAMNSLMKLDLVIVLLGTGEKKYHDLFEKLAKRYPEKLGVKITFNNTLAHKIEAGSDMFLMPSRYEPCGLNQIYSLRYGTIPIVRDTGGLSDTIKEFKPGKGAKQSAGNGFKFKRYSSNALLRKVSQATTVYSDKKEWAGLVSRAMGCDFSWRSSAVKYIELYRSAIKRTG